MKLRNAAPKKKKGGAVKKNETTNRTLQTMMEMAQYEINTDPYRGMLLDGGPWGVCSYGQGGQPVDDAIETLVVQACHCKCPSLTTWTRAKKKSGKRKRNGAVHDSTLLLLGRRNSDESFRCCCDYNPLCLCSLGGAMDDVLANATSRRVAQQNEISHALETTDDEQQDVSEKKKVIVVELDNTSESDDGCDDQVPDAMEAVDKDFDQEMKSCNASPMPGLAAEESPERAAATTHTLKVAAEEKSPALQQPPSEPVFHHSSNVYMADLQVEEQFELDPSKEKSVYAKGTAEQLLQLRKSFKIKEEPVRSFVKKCIWDVLQSDTAEKADCTVISVDDYMTRLGRWHGNMLFSNPLDMSQSSADTAGVLTLSIPPGIKNLGATCYLNTQLQCLAQNIAFLDGIFSWREPVSVDDGEHRKRMNSVMSTMQLLLARMVYGAECTITTAEFSEALGLENDEMQDPNEFARLLFERMHESFQQCSTNAGVAEPQQNLANLLPKIFHGVTTYETTCLTCRQTSDRSEGFMDLNLPIVKIADNSKLFQGMPNIKDSFKGGRVVDSDVQDCLDRYTCVELLNGENQYFCSVCQSKQDAERLVTFRQLPPVLNVQLCRYVFDRKKLMKKKLTDKVLLPRTLRVARKGIHNGSHDSQPTNVFPGIQKYILCAVMKHQGNSAYRGHYVAEVMDWQTGSWYEFNDEIVTAMPNGPSCSYMPSADCPTVEAGDKGRKNKQAVGARLEGSADAYNLYYVDSSFLARCANSHIQQGDSSLPLMTQPSAGKKKGNIPKQCKEVSRTVSLERMQRYELLAEMCLNDGTTANRLRRRRSGIIQLMFGEQNHGSQGLIGHSVPACHTSRSPVWVDGVVLRQFLSCSGALDDMLNSSVNEPVLRHRHLLCSHDTGLHPRIARRGKLLPRHVYDAYVSLLLGEKRLLRGDRKPEERDEQTAWRDEDVNDCIITPESNLYCRSCADAYRCELAEKLELTKKLMLLHDELDPKNDSGSSLQNEDDYCYIVSRTFCTALRARIGKLLMKKAESFGEIRALISLAPSLAGRENSIECICEGLDALDLSAFLPREANEDDDHALDFSVNRCITCEHGQCNVASNRRAVRYVSENVWNVIKQVFPGAICHRRKRTPRGPDSSLCEQCQIQKEENENLLIRLQAWVTKTLSREEGALQDLKSRKQAQGSRSGTSPDESLKTFEQYLVHRSDIKLWRKGLSHVKDAKRNSEDLLSILRKHFLSSKGDQTAGQKGAAIELASMTTDVGQEDQNCSVGLHSCLNLRSLLCHAHHKTVPSSISLHMAVPATASQGDVRVLAAHVEALSEAQYLAFVASMCEVFNIIAPGINGEAVYSRNELAMVLPKTHHPKLCFGAPIESQAVSDSSSSAPFRLLLCGDARECKVNPELCPCPSCCEAVPGDEGSLTVEATSYKSVAQTEEPDIVCIDGPHSDSNHYDAPQFARGLDSEKEPKLSFRVFEIQSGTSIEASVSMLVSFLVGPTESDTGGAGAGILRRSSRKRKTIYPEGTVGETEVSVCRQHNIAALRLHLYEKCPSFAIDEDLAFVAPPKLGESSQQPVLVDGLSTAQEEPSPLIIGLPLEWNHRTIEEVFEISDMDKLLYDGNMPSAARPFLVRYSDDGQSDGDRKILRRERKEGREAIMDALLETANTMCDETPSQGKKGTRRVERGFRGTLLHSSTQDSVQPHATNSEENCCNSSQSSNKPSATANRPGDVSEVNGRKSLDAADANTPASDRLSVADGKTETPGEASSASSYCSARDSKGVSPTKMSYQGNVKKADEKSTMASNPTFGPASNETKEDVLKVELRRVLTKGSSPVDESRLRVAVRWARRNSSEHTEVSTLTDMAYAKYLE